MNENNKNNLPTMNEYIKENNPQKLYNFSTYSEPLFKCPVCGGPVRKNLQIVLTSYPPKYLYVCDNCGSTEYLDF